MIFKTHLVSALGGLVLAAALPSTVALAGDHDKKDHPHATAPSESVLGTVEAVSPKDVTVKDAAGNSTKVEFNKDTQYDNSGKAGSVHDLRAGMTVTINCAKQKDGSLRATTVRYDKNVPAAG